MINIKSYNDFNIITESINEPKVQKLVDELNALIEKAYDSDGDPIGVIDPTGTWEEPTIYEPIIYKNGYLKITSYSPYKNKKETYKILKRDMEYEGIGTLRHILKQYRKAVKNKDKQKYTD